MRSVRGCLLSLVLLGAALIAGVGIALNRYYISRDIDGWKERAQVSSEPNDMHEYMSNVREGLESRGMTEGNADIIFPNPDNDMALIFRAVTQHVDQSLVLTEMDRSSPEYQTGLDNLRGSIRELDLRAGEFWNWHQGLFLWIIAIVCGAVGLILGFVNIEE